ncbi:MAG: hypothetical protein KGJ70_14215 [Gemmatimonadota bacterium]|nr:hypothetical protein [Gemmatimonadota bacterium]
MKTSRRVHMRLAARSSLLLGLAAMAGVAACNANISNPAKGVPVVGSYHLALVNGSPLPYQSGARRTVRGTLSVNANVTYSLSETDSGAAGLTTFSSSGRWSILAQQLTLIDGSSGVYTATLSAQLDSMSIPINGHTSIYAKN